MEEMETSEQDEALFEVRLKYSLLLGIKICIFRSDASLELDSL